MANIDTDWILGHFNSLGLPVEQYRTEDHLCETMWESLLEDGIVQDDGGVDDENIYYECQSAASKMWEEHLNEVARGNVAGWSWAEAPRPKVVTPEPDRYCASPNNPTGTTLGEVLKVKLEEVKGQADLDQTVSKDVLPPLESFQKPSYVSKRTRELERQLEASRARDARCVELGSLLDGLTGEDAQILHELLHEHFRSYLEDTDLD